VPIALEAVEMLVMVSVLAAGMFVGLLVPVVVVLAVQAFVGQPVSNNVVTSVPALAALRLVPADAVLVVLSAVQLLVTQLAILTAMQIAGTLVLTAVSAVVSIAVQRHHDMNHIRKAE
jgi:hypothetical protein